MTKAKYNIERKCKMCGESFLAKTLDSVYCSRRCSWAAYRQKKRAEVQRQELDEIAKSRPMGLLFTPLQKVQFSLPNDHSVVGKDVFRLL